jgi:hypothetical protein
MDCPSICIVPFSENETAAVPVPVGSAEMICSDEILNLTPEPCKNAVTQLRCDGTTVCPTA